MRGILSSMMVLTLCAFPLVWAGCEGGKADGNADAVIKKSADLKTPQEKETYLLEQAQALCDGKKADEALKVVNEVLANVNKESTKAQEMLKTIQEQIAADAKAKVDEAKTKMEGSETKVPDAPSLPGGSN